MAKQEMEIILHSFTPVVEHIWLSKQQIIPFVRFFFLLRNIWRRRQVSSQTKAPIS